MGYIDLVRCALVLRCGLAGVVWYLYAGWGTSTSVSDVNASILRILRLICWVTSWVVLIWFDVCWCCVVVWLGWCGICMQAEALVLQFRMLMHPFSGSCDLFVELFHGLYWSGSMCVGVTLWFGCGGVVFVCRLKHYSVVLQPAYRYHTTTAKPQRNTNTNPTRSM